MLSKLTLRGKMIAAFSFMALLMALLAATALLKLAALNANTVDIGTNWLPSVETLGDVNGDVALVRLSHFRQVAAKDAPAQASADKLLAWTTS